MAEVTGSIGNEPVELNNAATEATLKLLLQATLSANRQTLDSIRNIAQSSGLDPASVAAANENLNRLALGTTRTGAALGVLGGITEQVIIGLSKVTEVTKEITAGTGNISGVFDVFSKMAGPGVLGAVLSGMQKLAAYQESLLQTYQSITRVGANFGGSLTDMRQAAADTFMTLDEFRDVISANGENFSRMGVTVNQGVTSFRQLSKELIGSEIGRDLRALGMSTKEMNEGMIDYIASTGGRTRKELENTESIKKATGEYLTELDALTKFTGISKKKLEEEQKKAQLNEAFQRKMASLGEAERLNLKTAYDKAAASGLVGATELVMSTALGLPPMVESAQLLSGLAPKTAASFNEMTRAAMTSGTTQKQVTDLFARGMIEAGQSAKNLGITGDALAMQQGKYGAIVTSLIAVENKLRAKGITDEAELREAIGKAYQEQIEQQKSEASQAVETQEAVQKLGQELLTKLLPIVSSLWNVMNPLVTTVSNVLTAMLKVPYLFEVLGAALVVAIGAMAIVKARAAAAAVGSMFGGPGSAGAGPGPGGAAGRAAGGVGAGIGSGVGAALTGLSTGLISLANPRAMLGTVTLGLLSGSLFISAKAFKEFTGVSWKDVGIATLAITGLAAGAAALSIIAPAILIGSAALGALGGAIWLLGKGLKEFPTDVFPSLNLSFGALGDIVSDVFRTINSVVSGMWTTIKSTFGLVWDVMSWPFKQIGSLVSGAFGGVSTLASGLYDGIKATFGLVWDVISWPFNQIGSLVSDAFGNITATIKSAGEFISNTFKTVIDKVVNFLGLIKGAISAVAGLFGLGERAPKNQSSPITATASIASARPTSQVTPAFLPTGTPTPVTNRSTMEFATGYSERQMQLPPLTEQARREVAEPNTFLARTASTTIETLNTQLIALNKLSEEMLKSIKESAEYARRNVDATRSLNPNLLKR